MTNIPNFFPYTCVVGKTQNETEVYSYGVTLAELYYGNKKPPGNYWLLNHRNDEIIHTQWGKFDKNTFKDDLLWFMDHNQGYKQVNIYAWIFLRFCQLNPDSQSFNKLLINWNGLGLKYFDHIKHWDDINDVLYPQDKESFLSLYSAFEGHFKKLNLPQITWGKSHGEINQAKVNTHGKLPEN